MSDRIRFFIQRFLERPFLHQVMVIAGSTFLGQLIVAGSSPIITRLYSPESLGILAVFVSILSPILSFATLRLDVASLLPESDRDANTLIYISLLSVTAFALLAALLVLTAGAWIVDILNAPRLGTYLYMLPVSVLMGGFFQALSYGVIRNKDFTAIGRAKLMQSIWMVICQLVLGVILRGPIGLFVADPVGRSSGTFRLAKSMWLSTPESERRRPKRDEMWAIFHRYRRFPQYSMGPAVLNTVALQLPSLLISASYGAGSTGIYALTQRILGMPLNLVSSAVAQVFLGNSNVLARTSLPELKHRTRLTMKWLAIIGVATVIPAALVAPMLFGRVFGEEWATAGIYIQLLAPMFISQFVSSPLGGVLDLLERQDLHLLREVVRTLLMLVAAVVAASYFDTAHGLVACLSVASSIGYVFGIYLVFKSITHAQNIQSAINGEMK